MFSQNNNVVVVKPDNNSSYHPSLPLYLPTDSLSKNRIKVRVS